MSAPAWSIDELRESVARHSYVADARGDCVCDVQTANAIVTVFDALNPENRAKLSSLPLHRVADIAWRLVK